MSDFFIEQSRLTVGSCLFIFFDLFLDKVELFIQKFLVVDTREGYIVLCTET